jgi:hypothetical protein
MTGYENTSHLELELLLCELNEELFEEAVFLIQQELTSRQVNTPFLNNPDIRGRSS